VNPYRPSQTDIGNSGNSATHSDGNLLINPPPAPIPSNPASLGANTGNRGAIPKQGTQGQHGGTGNIVGNLPSENPVTITTPCFYSSREQKLMGIRANSIRRSISIGVLLTPSHVYSIYNTGDSIKLWPEEAEYRYKAFAQQEICRTLLPHQYSKGEVGGILVGSGMEILRRHLELKPPRESELTHPVLRILKEVYQPMYFITNDKYGEAQLKLLSHPHRLEALHSGIRGKKFHQPNSRMDIEHDAVTEDGLPVLFCCIIDIPRLVRFRTGISQGGGKRGQVVCFAHQEEVLRGYLGERVEVSTIPSDKFLNLPLLNL